MKEEVLLCKGMSVGYGEETVLSNVDFTLTAGELLPVIGPNGAGKTTFLRALLGLVPVRSGSLELSLQGKPPGYVPQHKHIDPLYPVSVRAIVAMGLYPELGYWHRPNSDQRRRIVCALEKFGLADHQGKTFGELSGGMRQKCLLARAFVTGATVFFLDEPTAGLDAASERWFLNHLVALNREEGKTILMAHHRLEDLSFLSKNVCMVDHKQVRRIPADQAWNHFQAPPKGGET
jgi:manganese/zinc/iron transport system ATP- binding protein